MSKLTIIDGPCPNTGKTRAARKRQRKRAIAAAFVDRFTNPPMRTRGEPVFKNLIDTMIKVKYTVGVSVPKFPGVVTAP